MDSVVSFAESALLPSSNRKSFVRKSLTTSLETLTDLVDLQSWRQSAQDSDPVETHSRKSTSVAEPVESVKKPTRISRSAIKSWDETRVRFDEDDIDDIEDEDTPELEFELKSARRASHVRSIKNEAKKLNRRKSMEARRAREGRGMETGMIGDLGGCQRRAHVSEGDSPDVFERKKQSRAEDDAYSSDGCDSREDADRMTASSSHAAVPDNAPTDLDFVALSDALEDVLGVADTENSCSQDGSVCAQSSSDNTRSGGLGSFAQAHPSVQSSSGDIAYEGDGDSLHTCPQVSEDACALSCVGNVEPSRTVEGVAAVKSGLEMVESVASQSESGIPKGETEEMRKWRESKEKKKKNVSASVLSYVIVFALMSFPSKVRRCLECLRCPACCVTRATRLTSKCYRLCHRRSTFRQPLLPLQTPGLKRSSSDPHLALPERCESPRRLRINSLVLKGTTALHSGFGSMMPVKGRLRANTSREKIEKSSCSWSLAMVLVSLAVSLPAVVWIQASSMIEQNESFFKSDIRAVHNAYVCLAVIPLSCAVVNHFVQHVRRTTFWWDRESRWFDPISCPLMLLVILWCLHRATLQAVEEQPAGHITFGIECLISMIVLLMYYRLLDLIDNMLREMKKEQYEINATKPVKKMQNIVRNITRTGKPEKDYVYTFAHTNTVPAEVLHYAWWVYYVAGKMLGAIIALAIFMNLDDQLIFRFLLGGVILSAGTSAGLVLELGPNMMSLARLSLYKPFYVGDLITLNSTGAMDSPVSIMGFVENITMSYVVIRNFEMKQTWISHKKFSEFVIQNWTRRPTKTVLLNIGISCRCALSKVEELTAFGKRWIKESPEIQQENYQKCNITKTANGYNIEIIFFPSIGVSHRGIRQKFLIAFMAAGERLDIPFVPLQLQQNFCDDMAPEDTTKPTLDDLLPDPHDLLPKGDD
eukprot:TRINITY_DN16776_c0_g4_i1.p1 TRINITY_DN16776_c0_g4~~TRINITY_DN16776_c0_g4_i1.p1  ORF type:complete len:931 (-),score=127.23 TRINITY_DN16776_c0_g4_i1:78-2870(-)